MKRTGESMPNTSRIQQNPLLAAVPPHCLCFADLQGDETGQIIVEGRVEKTVGQDEVEEEALSVEWTNDLRVIKFLSELTHLAILTSRGPKAQQACVSHHGVGRVMSPRPTSGHDSAARRISLTWPHHITVRCHAPTG